MQEMQETRARSLGQEDPLEEVMATHSSILAWKIPRTEEPDRLRSIGVQKKSDITEHALFVAQLLTTYANLSKPLSKKAWVFTIE